jgi:hypothetical protein
MKPHLLPAVIAIALIVTIRLGICADEHLPFKFPKTEIIIKVQDSKSTTKVAKSYSIDKPSGKKTYHSGFEKAKNETSQGEVLYKYDRTTDAGDFYTFTVTRPGEKTETINYTFTGGGKQLYSKDGISIVIQENAG